MSVLIMMMRPSLLTLLAVAATMTLLSLDNTVHAFVPNGGMQSTQRCQPFFLAATLPTPEESAKALQNYMARSHEEKIKAIAAVEEKYRNQILVGRREGECLFVCLLFIMMGVVVLHHSLTHSHMYSIVVGTRKASRFLGGQRAGTEYRNFLCNACYQQGHDGKGRSLPKLFVGVHYQGTRGKGQSRCYRGSQTEGKVRGYYCGNEGIVVVTGVVIFAVMGVPFSLHDYIPPRIARTSLLYFSYASSIVFHSFRSAAAIAGLLEG